jgi:hypothetical protein
VGHLFFGRLLPKPPPILHMETAISACGIGLGACPASPLIFGTKVQPP